MPETANRNRFWARAVTVIGNSAALRDGTEIAQKKCRDLLSF